MKRTPAREAIFEYILYNSFPESAAIGNIGKVSDIVIRYFRETEVVRVPERGRQMDVTPLLD